MEAGLLELAFPAPMGQIPSNRMESGMKNDRARQLLRERMDNDPTGRWLREYMWRYCNPEKILGDRADPVWLAARKQRRRRELIADLGLKVIKGGRE
jgi:hypothetical protein